MCISPWPPSGTLGGLFSQILQGEDVVRERAIKFLSLKIKTLPEDVMTKEVQDYVFAETKKVRLCFQMLLWYFPGGLILCGSDRKGLDQSLSVKNCYCANVMINSLAR